MTFALLLSAVGYDPQPYRLSDLTCWSVSARGLSVGIVAGAILDFERDGRLDPDERAVAIRALRGACETGGLHGSRTVVYFPTERPAADDAAARSVADAPPEATT